MSADPRVTPTPRNAPASQPAAARPVLELELACDLLRAVLSGSVPSGFDEEQRRQLNAALTALTWAMGLPGSFSGIIVMCAACFEAVGGTLSPDAMDMLQQILKPTKRAT